MKCHFGRQAGRTKEKLDLLGKALSRGKILVSSGNSLLPVGTHQAESAEVALRVDLQTLGSPIGEREVDSQSSVGAQEGPLGVFQPTRRDPHQHQNQIFQGERHPRNFPQKARVDRRRFDLAGLCSVEVVVGSVARKNRDALAEQAHHLEAEARRTLEQQQVARKTRTAGPCQGNPRLSAQTVTLRSQGGKVRDRPLDPGIVHRNRTGSRKDAATGDQEQAREQQPRGPSQRGPNSWRNSSSFC